MKKVLTELVKYTCDQKDIRVEPLSDGTGFKFRLAGENSIFVGGIEIDEEQGTISVLTYLPVKICKNAMSKMTELVARINEIVHFGNFELHFETSRICYRTSIIFGNAPACSEIIEHLVFTNWSLADEFFPVVAEVLFGKFTPQRAIERFLRSKDLPSESKATAKSSEFIRRNYRDIVDGSLN